MVGSRNSPTEVSSYLRKIRKPMIEKQRRERMNTSISQLKMLIAGTIKQQTTPLTRVDKADILELTVYHLTQLQQQQRSATMATEAAAYDTGFKDCARETVTYMKTSGLCCESGVSGLNNHLHDTFVMKTRKRQPQRNHGKLSTPIRPAGVTCTSSDLSSIGCSPILPSANDITYPDLTASFVERFTGSFTDSMESRTSDSESSDFSVSLSFDSSSSASSDVTSGGVVTIGDGKGDAVGHAIKEQVWRPW